MYWGGGGGLRKKGVREPQRRWTRGGGILSIQWNLLIKDICGTKRRDKPFCPL